MMHAQSKIAVVGATGRAGRHVVDILEAAGCEVVPISRTHGVDVITGDGLAEALTGVETVVDVATGPSPDRHEATEFFTTATRNLHEAGERSGVQRIIVVSIIGIDRYVGGYYAAKIAHEQASLAGPVPVTILRAAQFHELVPLLVEWGTQDDVCHLEQMRTQLVAARTVAEELAGLATAPTFAPGAISEIAGPREESLVEIAKLLVARRGDALQIEGMSPSSPDAELSATGTLLPSPAAKLAGPTFAQWLEVQQGVGAKS